MSHAPYSSSADWLRPAEEQEGLKQYVETIRERLRLIVLVVLLTTLVALVYVLTATKTYEATADMLITPISGDDPVLTSLGLLRESADPTRDVQTASQLITNIDVARRAAEQLGEGDSAEDLLGAVSAEPVASSNIVAVTATEDSAAKARVVANAFAEAAVQERTATMHEQIDERLPRLEAIADSTSEADETGAITVSSQIAELRALASGPDPTMRVQTKATTPTAPSSPRRTLSIAAGIIAGLILGVAAAFALQVLDPRLRRESQLQRLYRLPILTRVPRAGRLHGNRPLIPGRVPGAIAEAYRTLRATVTAPGRSGESDAGRVVLVTGSSASEGKSTSAANLASSLALLGRSVILIEADLRKPSLARFFGLTVGAEGGVVSVLTNRVTLQESLIQPDNYGGNLNLLLAESAIREGWVADLFSTPGGETMIATARGIADYVVIDSPPLNEVVDTLPLAVAADDVLIVARLGQTRMDRLHELGELLAENDIRPAGFVLNGTAPPRQRGYQYTSRLGNGHSGQKINQEAVRPSAPR